MNKFCLWFLLFAINKAPAQFDAVRQYEVFKKFHSVRLLTNGRYSIVNNNNLYGVIDKDLNVKIPICHQTISIVNDTFAICGKDEYYLIDIASNKILIPPYSYIRYFSKDLYICKEQEFNKFGIVNSHNKIMLPFDFGDISQIQDSFLILNSYGKYALVNENLEFLIKLNVDYIMTIGQGFCVLVNDSFYVHDINGVKLTNGMSVCPLEFDSYQFRYSNTMAEKLKNGIGIYEDGSDLVGVLDASGKEIIPCKYNKISKWPTLYLAELEGKTYLYNRQGKLLNRQEIDKYTILNNYLVEVKSGEKYGIMDTTGKLIFQLKYDLILKRSPNIFELISQSDHNSVFIGQFGNNLTRKEETVDGINNTDMLIVVKDHLYGIKNIAGKRVLPYEYTDIMYCQAFMYKPNWMTNFDLKRDPNGFNSYIVKKDRKCKYLNSRLNELNGMNFKECHCFSEGLAKVRMDHNFGFGYCDTSGNVVIDPKFEEAEPFNFGHAVVKYFGSYGLINNKGEIILNYEFDNVQFDNGLWKASKVGLFGLYNDIGTQILPNKFTDIRISNLAVMVQIGDFYGLYDRNGKLIIPIENQSIECVFSVFFITQKNGLQAIYDYQGNLIIPYKYKKLRIVDFCNRIIATTVLDEIIEINFTDKIY